MTEQEKRLLLIDLSARLPYGVILYDEHCKKDYKLISLDVNCFINYDIANSINHIKPYLRPMSSMTDKEINEYRALSDEIDVKYGPCDFTFNLHHIRLGIKPDNPHECVDDFVDVGAIDFLNKHHFDYRGLISMGLAIEAPKDMYEIPHSTT